MSKNLFYGLPEVLQSEIYQYDNTYRIFGTKPTIILVVTLSPNLSSFLKTSSSYTW